jgi:hypothetical protein
MKLLSLIVAAALLLTIAIACQQANNKQAAAIQTEELKKENTGTIAAADTATVMTEAPPANPDWDKKIIKTADLTIEAKKFQVFTDRLHKVVRQSGGYIAREQQSQSSSSVENSVSIKVPVDRFDDLLLQLASDSDKLIQKNISSEDVTAKIIDTKSRLETKKEVRIRYLDLLKQAKNMKDILTVQNEINELQEEMDAASGQIAYMGHSAAFSTINLRFYQLLDGAPAEDPSPTFFKKLKDAVGEGWNWCSSLMLGLVSIWPLLLAAALGWYGLRRRFFNGRKKMQASEV